MYVEMIGILPRYNSMKCLPQSMSGTLLGTCCKMSATVQNKCVCYVHCVGQLRLPVLPRTVNKCQVSYIYPIAGLHETVGY